VIIYLDESKKIWEWRIVFGGFISKHKHQYIQKVVVNKKISYWFSPYLELKGTKDTWKEFYNRMIQDIDFVFIKDTIIWLNARWYDRDSLENYLQCIVEIISKLYNKVKPYPWKITIYADKLYLGKISEVEKIITQTLNQKFPSKWGITFLFRDSKSNSWIQISDLLSYQMRIWNINQQKIDGFLSENSMNIDLQEEFLIQKKT